MSIGYGALQVGFSLAGSGNGNVPPSFRGEDGAESDDVAGSSHGQRAAQQTCCGAASRLHTVLVG